MRDPSGAGGSGSHSGSRRSVNAAGPSAWSGWPHIDTSSAAPARQASVSPCSKAAHSARLVAAIAAGEFRATSSASSWAASRRRSGGSTTWLSDAELVGPLGREPLAPTDQRHAQHRLGRGLPHQPDRLVGGHLADRHVRVDELGAGGGDHDVGVGHEVQPAAGAHAVDRRDDRLAHLVVPRRQPQLGPPGAPRLLAQRVAIAGQLDDVETGLEGGAVAGVDDDAHVGIVVELVPRRLELAHHGRVHRVAGVGPVEHQPADRDLAVRRPASRRCADRPRASSAPRDVAPRRALPGIGITRAARAPARRRCSC